MKCMKNLTLSFEFGVIPLNAGGLGPTLYKFNLIRSSSIDFFHKNKK